jgi:hypothetical protein
MDHLSGIQNPVMTAATTEIAVFELRTGAKCMEHVAILFDHNAFIFPGFWDLVMCRARLSSKAQAWARLDQAQA